MKDTVPRITFFVGRAWEVGGLVKGSRFVSLDVFSLAWPRTQSFFCVPGFA